MFGDFKIKQRGTHDMEILCYLTFEHFDWAKATGRKCASFIILL